MAPLRKLLETTQWTSIISLREVHNELPPSPSGLSDPVTLSRAAIVAEPPLEFMDALHAVSHPPGY